MVNHKQYDVFISYYLKTGGDFARFLKKSLLDFNVSAFLDEEDIPKTVKADTDEWRQIIDEAIKNSSNLVLIMTIGFNKRPEVTRELKVAFGTSMKRIYARLADIEKADSIVVIDDKPVDLTNYENIVFSNEIDLVRKVISALLGKLGQPKESFFTSEARRMIGSEGLELKKTNSPLFEMVIGSTNEKTEWLPVNSKNFFLVSRFPDFVETDVRRSFFESRPNENVFFKVQTNGYFHIVRLLYLDEKDSELMDYDTIFCQVVKPFLFAIRLMKFHMVASQQSLLILLKNVGGKMVCFDTWAGRLHKRSFTGSVPEIQFLFSFNPKDDWSKITDVLLNFYRELCTETGCLDTTDLIIKKRVREVLANMTELKTRYLGDNVQLPTVDIASFGLEDLSH